MSEWWMAVTAGAAALSCLVAVVVGLRAHRRTERELRAAREEQRDLRERLERLTSPATSAASGLPEFVITGMDAGDEHGGGQHGASAGNRPAPPATRLEGRLFADIVLRETLVKAVSWGYGVRRALSAEQRNRLRFEVRRETRRTARQRRADTKEALRQYYARGRGDVA